MEKGMIEVEAGRVLLPEFAPWLAALEKELAAFGANKYYDDQVDALSQAIHFFHWFITHPAARISRRLLPH